MIIKILQHGPYYFDLKETFLAPVGIKPVATMDEIFNNSNEEVDVNIGIDGDDLKEKKDSDESEEYDSIINNMVKQASVALGCTNRAPQSQRSEGHGCPLSSDSSDELSVKYS